MYIEQTRVSDMYDERWYKSCFVVVHSTKIVRSLRALYERKKLLSFCNKTCLFNPQTSQAIFSCRFPEKNAIKPSNLRKKNVDQETLNRAWRVRALQIFLFVIVLIVFHRISKIFGSRIFALFRENKRYLWRVSFTCTNVKTAKNIIHNRFLTKNFLTQMWIFRRYYVTQTSRQTSFISV